MQTRNLRADAILLLVAAIWGFGFVAQRVGMDQLGPFGFNGSRFLLGALSLLPLLLFFKAKPGQAELGPLLKGGLLAGLFLFMGASLQQVGLLYTTAGNAGFITGLYIILVPMIALIWGQRTGLNTWAGSLLAVCGLYLLSVDENFGINKGDMLELIGALFWAGHVLLIGKISPQLDSLRLSIVQFLVCALLCLGVALVWEPGTLTVANLGAEWLPIAYAGLFSVGIAYTLQVVAQKDAPASHAAIILSLEAAFAALGGWWLLDEYLDSRALMGCGLMLAGMLLSQLPVFGRRSEKASLAAS
ncbi:DMT family transporter [Marinobacterium arenosum]|uniref:DMT family transporter n=1 Tax=Marinobacterium arenosum TaxID=2862496 RepID=UPI001C982C62|nr:DMT family transporter [Marinobacterium arenosum]MBY4678547.1 DMT family transporter [Marinobacterium arenosum]